MGEVGRSKGGTKLVIQDSSGSPSAYTWPGAVPLGGASKRPFFHKTWSRQEHHFATSAPTPLISLSFVHPGPTSTYLIPLHRYHAAYRQTPQHRRPAVTPQQRRHLWLALQSLRRFPYIPGYCCFRPPATRLGILVWLCGARVSGDPRR